MSGVIGDANIYTAGAESVVLVDAGGGKVDLITCDWYSGAGDDSPPLPGDSITFIETSGNGRYAAVSCDDRTTKTATAGEKRIYARNPAGAVMATVHLKGTGEIEISQEAGTASIVIDPAGQISLSGVSVSLQTGTSLGQYLTALHNVLTTAWVVAPQDGGLALKTAWTAAMAALPPPGP